MIDHIRKLILEAKRKADAESGSNVEPQFAQKIDWPVTCTVGPGLEGAIACESAVGYVNGSAGKLIYRGYDVFDLCAYSTFEEVTYLLLHGELPTEEELDNFKAELCRRRHVPRTLRQLMSNPIEEMNDMAALRLGVDFLRRTHSKVDTIEARPRSETAISSDEDSIPMEKAPYGEKKAIYEFTKNALGPNKPVDLATCYDLIAAMPTIVAAVHRIKAGKLPIEPHPDLGHAANFLYMIRGEKPSLLEEKVMDVALILHADHGMNASTFATMVVASTLSDIYFSIGAGIAALNGPLHGGANEAAIKALQEIGHKDNVRAWLDGKLARKEKIPGFGHRVYKAYDPRARILGPLAKELAKEHPECRTLTETAEVLEEEMVRRFGESKGIFPNVDFYSGLVYMTMGLDHHLFTPIFAVSRVAGWTARTIEYLENNRIFRPRAVYTGSFDKKYKPLAER
ncbi:MAG: citrate synthase/methylcitrate synthase [Firmicutes bacterium]|nr:citrate synthase/methylcitrate synthase [Bacillota bacterium]